MKNSHNRKSLPGIIVLCLGSAIALLCRIMKNWLIVAFGIRQFNFFNTLSLWIMLAGGILTLIPLISTIQGKMRQRRTEQQSAEPTPVRSKDPYDPNVIAHDFQQLYYNVPSFNDLIAKCALQMQRMDDLQDRQNRLITDNDAIYLTDTVEVLNSVERRICQNLRSIINHCIAAGDSSHIDWSDINPYLQDNEEKLSNAKELIDVSVDWINQRSNSKNSDREQIENWIAVIRESLRQDTPTTQTFS